MKLEMYKIRIIWKWETNKLYYPFFHRSKMAGASLTQDIFSYFPFQKAANPTDLI